MTIKTDRVLLRQFARWVRHDRAVTDIDTVNKRRQLRSCVAKGLASHSGFQA